MYIAYKDKQLDIKADMIKIPESYIYISCV